jgi:hypothetical protein
MIPKVAVPNYELIIPSNGKKITVRPFLVKEEKILLMAVESNNLSDIINTTKQVIKDCIVSEDVNIDTLPYFDIDYLMVALRAKSIGETIDVKFTCKHEIDGKECGNTFKATIDVSNCTVKKPDVENVIKIGNTHTIKLKYPTYGTMKFINDNDSIINKKLNLIAGCIDNIQQKQKVYTAKDVTPKEMGDFLEGLTKADFSKLENFVDNLPTFVITTQAKCTKCEFVHNIEYTDFESFFV